MKFYYIPKTYLLLRKYMVCTVLLVIALWINFRWQIVLKWKALSVIYSTYSLSLYTHPYSIYKKYKVFICFYFIPMYKYLCCLIAYSNVIYKTRVEHKYTNNYGLRTMYINCFAIESRPQSLICNHSISMLIWCIYVCIVEAYLERYCQF